MAGQLAFACSMFTDDQIETLEWLEDNEFLVRNFMVQQTHPGSVVDDGVVVSMQSLFAAGKEA
eukprot:scaffold267953_cov29-Prasinocladus_malaysianus.AAC.1